MKLWIAWEEDRGRINSFHVSSHYETSSTKEKLLEKIKAAPSGFWIPEIVSIQEVEIDTFYVIEEMFHCFDLSEWRKSIYWKIKNRDPMITFGEEIPYVKGETE
jgi:hypothetical protein